MTVMPATELRAGLADAVSRVAYGGERIVIDSRGKHRAAIVSMDDLNLLERLENEIDIAKAKKAIKEGGRIPLDEVKKQLGP